METTPYTYHVPPAEEAWDEEETLARPRPGYARVSAPANDLAIPGPDEANSDLGNSGRDVTEADETPVAASRAA